MLVSTSMSLLPASTAKLMVLSLGWDIVGMSCHDVGELWGQTGAQGTTYLRESFYAGKSS